MKYFGRNSGNRRVSAADAVIGAQRRSVKTEGLDHDGVVTSEASATPQRSC